MAYAPSLYAFFYSIIFYTDVNMGISINAF